MPSQKGKVMRASTLVDSRPSVGEISSLINDLESYLDDLETGITKVQQVCEPIMARDDAELSATPKPSATSPIGERIACLVVKVIIMSKRVKATVDDIAL